MIEMRKNETEIDYNNLDYNHITDQVIENILDRDEYTYALIKKIIYSTLNKIGSDAFLEILGDAFKELSVDKFKEEVNSRLCCLESRVFPVENDLMKLKLFVAGYSGSGSIYDPYSQPLDSRIEDLKHNIESLKDSLAFLNGELSYMKYEKEKENGRNNNSELDGGNE